ncbi:MAG: hypothetical protein ACTSO7_14860 [Candidatus Heimdallarchaeota archaeon]
MSNEKETNDYEIVYQEWVSISAFVIVSISLLLVVLVSVIITTLKYLPQDILITIPFCSVLAVFFIFIGVNFRGIKITITREEIEVKYGLSKKTIPFIELTECEETTASFKKYWGFGIRKGTDGSLVYSTDLGEAVKLTYQNDKLFVFSTRNSQEICDILDKNIEKNEKTD